MKASRVEQAARNNAIWCDTICRLHGAPGEFLENAWVNRHRIPTYYPNLVTFHQGPGRTALQSVRDLISQNLPGGWAVKDSFQELDLSELGFERLFEAAWIWHDLSVQFADGPASDIRWMPVASPDELQLWESAWAKANGTDDASRKFYPPLLVDHHVVVLAGFQGKQLVAGGIANSPEAVVGLSNVFAPANRETQVWADLLTNVQRLFPKKHVVGYERGSDLKAARQCGFEEIGALNVWLRRD